MLGPSLLRILALASPHRNSIELSQDRKIHVKLEGARENKKLITLTLEITLDKVMYLQYLSFSLQQYGTKFCQLCGDVIYNLSCIITHETSSLISGDNQSHRVPDK